VSIRVSICLHYIYIYIYIYIYAHLYIHTHISRTLLAAANSVILRSKFLNECVSDVSIRISIWRTTRNCSLLTDSSRSFSLCRRRSSALYVCMYVCVYVCVCVYIYIYLCKIVYVHIHTFMVFG
jgi:hypothetical protein